MRLIATGSTNRQIAEALCISGNTVSHHLRNIFAKTATAKQFEDLAGLLHRLWEINEDHLTLKVLVNIFGRETPVELQFSQVAKL